MDRRGDYQRIEPNSRGQLECHVLRLTLEIANGDLLLCNWQTGQPLLTEADAHAKRADDMQARNAMLEAELHRLREELGRDG